MDSFLDESYISDKFVSLSNDYYVSWTRILHFVFLNIYRLQWSSLITRCIPMTLYILNWNTVCEYHVFNWCKKASMKYPMISQKFRFVLWHGCHVRCVIQQLIGWIHQIHSIFFFNEQDYFHVKMPIFNWIYVWDPDGKKKNLQIVFFLKLYCLQTIQIESMIVWLKMH